MTIRQRSNQGFCSAQFWIDSVFYQFTFNGKKGMPLITSRKEAREFENELKREIKTGAFLKDSELKNFAKFFEEIYMEYSRQHKAPLSTEFDEFYGKRLVEEFGARALTQISSRMIEKYLDKLLHTDTQFGRPHSPVTVRRHYNMLNQVFNMAIRERIIHDNPCRLVSRTVLKGLPTWQNRNRWLNKYAPDEEERLFASFNDYGAHLPAICRIVLNTGIRPPREVLAIKKEHVNLSNEQRYRKVDRTDVLIPPRAVLVRRGKDGRPRVLPLNRIAQKVFDVLVRDATAGEWLFTNRNDEPLKAIKKGFNAACVRAGIENLRAYDLRHTFATRLLERGVHHFIISALLGHSAPLSGFGYGSRITPGYAHATWSAMVSAVERLEQPVQHESNWIVAKSWQNDLMQATAGKFRATVND